jgi:hypothetical protein
MDPIQLQKQIDDLKQKIVSLESSSTITRNVETAFKERLGLNTATITVKSYSGSVNSNGTAGNLPTGWTSTKLGTGDYQVTHNLGTTAYNFAAISNGGVFRTMAIYGKATNTFELASLNVGSSPSLIDSAFDFILMLV